MRAAPVRLKHYHLTKIAIEPAAGYEVSQAVQDDPYPDFKHASFQIGVHVARDAKDRCIHLVAVDLKAEPKAGQPFPYVFHIGAEGIVSCHGEEDETTIRSLAAVNGCSLLYSALRETLLSLSVRLPNGPVMLPSANFNDLRNDLVKPEPAPEPPAAKPAAARRAVKLRKKAAPAP